MRFRGGGIGHSTMDFAQRPGDSDGADVNTDPPLDEDQHQGEIKLNPYILRILLTFLT